MYVCLAASPIFGNMCNCSCEDPVADNGYCGEFSLGGNWLYVRPDISSVEFARVVQEIQGGSTIDTAERKCLKTKFDQGYEFFASYKSATSNCAAWDMRAGFLSQDFSGNTKVSVPASTDELVRNIIPLMGFRSDVRDFAFFSSEGKLFLDLTEIHGEAGWNYIPSCATFFRAFAGVTYTNLKQKMHFFYSDPAIIVSTQTQQTEIDITQVSKFSGIGPRVGFFANWNFCWGVSLFGDFAASILFAKTSGSYSQSSYLVPFSTFDETIFRSNESFCHNKRTIPSLDLRVGLSVKLICLSCFNFSVQGGYRSIHYFDAFEFLKFSSNELSSASTENSYFASTTWLIEENYALSGWFVGGSIGF